MYHSISGDKETAHPYYHINTSPAVFAEAGCRKTEVGEDCGEPRCGPQVGEQGQHQTHRHRSCRLDGGGEDGLRHSPDGPQENHLGPAEEVVRVSTGQNFLMLVNYMNNYGYI